MIIYICSECGKEIPQNSDFCYQCGSLKEKAHKIEYKADRQLSGEGTICPECGLSNDKEFKFCKHCGFEVGSTSARSASTVRPPQHAQGYGYGTRSPGMPVLQKNGRLAMFMSIIFGLMGVYGIGHLIMKRWSRGLMFVAISAVNWYIYISAGTFPSFIMLISLLMFFKQSMEITNIAYGRY